MISPSLIQWLIFSVTIGGLSDADVILVNNTGLAIARIEIDHRRFETDIQHLYGKILVNVTPTKHHLKIVFRGGSDVDWPNLDFQGVHEIFFERVKNKIQAHLE